MFEEFSRNGRFSDFVTARLGTMSYAEASAWHLAAINIEPAWRDYNGHNVLVAVVDDGVD